ncbi:Aldose 1-epimerase [Zea mays]|uniref:Aldose 1-epimerase n=1 Tax=Zea mays TaxID=4577 RepID=A0A1D6EFQ7_MAIZE|nr:Aldose 1-epimerase [Zea mays]
MEQLVGVHHHHHSLSPRAPRTPTRPQPHPHPLLHHLPSNRFRDLHSQIHNHIHPAVPAASRVLRATPPFFLTLLASVYLLASVTIFSTPTPLLRLRLASPRPLILPKPAPPPPAPELFDLDVGSVRVCLTNVGAAVTSFLVPDKNGAGSLWYLPSVCLCSTMALTLLFHDARLVFLPGVLADVVLGFDSLDPYLVSS